jgi:hypothetical protein
MNEFYENLKREAAANPIMTMAIAASLLAGASKFVEALGHYKGSAAFAKDAERRFRASKR